MVGERGTKRQISVYAFRLHLRFIWRFRAGITSERQHDEQSQEVPPGLTDRLFKITHSIVPMNVHAEH